MSILLWWHTNSQDVNNTSHDDVVMAGNDPPCSHWGRLQLTQSYVHHDTPRTGPERSEGWEDGRTNCRRLVNHIMGQTLHNSDCWERGSRWRRSKARLQNSELTTQINATTSLTHSLDTWKPELALSQQGWKRVTENHEQSRTLPWWWTDCIQLPEWSAVQDRVCLTLASKQLSTFRWQKA